jgi:hypothetical protein
MAMTPAKQAKIDAAADKQAAADAAAAPKVDMAKVEVLTDQAIINGHELKAGTVVELPVSVIDVHRDHGVCLGAVADDDTREVYDVSEPPPGIDTAA